MKRRIVTFACVFGLLLAVAMVCASLAQLHKLQQATTTSPCSKRAVRRSIRNVSEDARDSSVSPQAPDSPPSSSAYPFISKLRHTHCAKSDSIKPWHATLELWPIDTPSGECWTLNGSCWATPEKPLHQR